MVVEALPGFIVAVVVLGLWREFVLDQGQHLGRVEERGEDSRSHSAKRGIWERRVKRGEKAKQGLRGKEKRDFGSERVSERVRGAGVYGEAR